MTRAQRVLPTGSAIAALDDRLPKWATVGTLFVLLLVAALIVDLLFGYAVRFRASPLLLEADEREYFDMASRLLTGTLETQSRRTLGYPLFLAAIRSLTPDFRLLQLVSALIYSLAPPLLFLAVRRVTGGVTVGFVAGLLLALWPPAVFYGTSLYSETAALPLFLAVLLLVPPGSRLPTGGRSAGLGLALAAGLMLGVTTHVRTMYQLFLPALLIILLVEEPRRRVALARFAVIALAWLAVILPWSIHLTRSLGHFILVTSNGGETLAGGLSPKLLERPVQPLQAPDRTTWVGPGKWLPINENGYLSPAEQMLPLDRQDELMQDRAKAWVLSHPLAAAYLEWRKVAYLWGVYPIARNGPAQTLFGNLPTIGLLVAALVAFLRTTWTVRAGLVRFWILPLFATGVALISWGSWRFRMPGDVGLIALCAYLGVSLYARATATDRQRDRRQVKIDDIA